MALDRARNLCHLHQGQHTLLHPRAARDGKSDHGQAVFQRVLEQRRDAVADHGSHRAEHEFGVHHEDRGLLPFNSGHAAENAFVFPAFRFCGRVFFPIVGEAERVGENLLAEQLLKGVGIREQIDPYPRGHGNVRAARGADPQVGVQFLFGKTLLAFRAGLDRKTQCVLLPLVDCFSYCHDPSISQKFFQNRLVGREIVHRQRGCIGQRAPDKTGQGRARTDLHKRIDAVRRHCA